MALEIERLSEELAKKNYFIRSMTYSLIALIFVGVIYTFYKIELPGETLKMFEFFQVVEAGINDIVFIGVAIFFLTSLEMRWKRKKALIVLKKLNALAHVIDMHQLNKDPQLLIATGPTTESSPKRNFTPFEFGRYLDYSSEMLSLIAKLSAYYVQGTDDREVVEASREVESLTTGLSRKIWQKLVVLHNHH